MRFPPVKLKFSFFLLFPTFAERMRVNSSLALNTLKDERKNLWFHYLERRQ